MAEITTRRLSSKRLVNGPSPVESKWPALLGSMVDDVSRVVELELELLQARLGRSMMAMTDHAIAGLMLLYAAIIGGSFLLAALVLWLHEERMAWSQCFAIGGVATIVVGLAAYAIVKGLAPAAESKT
jgi:hypothetical protein